jgi:hypothetical protein
MLKTKTAVNVDLFMHNTETSFDHQTTEQGVETEGNWRDKTVLYCVTDD